MCSLWEIFFPKGSCEDDEQLKQMAYFIIQFPWIHWIQWIPVLFRENSIDWMMDFIYIFIA